MTAQHRAWEIPTILGRRPDPVAALLFLAGAFAVAWTSQLNFRHQDANWDLLNYHAYVPSSLLNGTWFSDIHPANMPTYLSPYQDLLMWPLVGGAPAIVTTAVLLALQFSILIPVGLTIQLLVPSLPRSRAMGVALIGVCGAMMITELGTTMGDIPPAILLSWAIYLLHSILSGQTSRPDRRAVLAGFLVGAAVSLKYTIAYTAPGLLIFVAAMVFSGNRRGGLLFLASSAGFAVLLCAPWALLLWVHMGSPVFPLFNSIFRAPRYPPIDYHDARFQVRSLVDLVALPLNQALGTTATAEIRFRDPRWLVAFLAGGIGIAAVAIRSRRSSVSRPGRGDLPGLTLIAFWAVSFVVWAVLFGIQRYAVLLEVLALPVIFMGVSLALPRLRASRASLATLVLLGGCLAITTVSIDFGHRTMTWAPMVPSQTIEPLTRYDAILIGEGPLAFLRAITRDAPGASDQIWMEPPYDAVDRAYEVEALAGKSVGVIFYVNQQDKAASVAADLGFELTGDCATFKNPLESTALRTHVSVCSAVPIP
jgi:hypothetical protein